MLFAEAYELDSIFGSIFAGVIAVCNCKTDVKFETWRNFFFFFLFLPSHILLFPGASKRRLNIIERT
jgi:hypothetical protein